MHPFFLPEDAIALAEVRRVLVIKLRHHGDVLLTSPLISAIKIAAPRADVDALVYLDTRDMIEGHPSLSQLHTIDRQWKKLGLGGQILAEWSLLKALKSRHYDLVIHLTEHNRGAWLTRLLNPRWAVAPEGNFGRQFDRAFTHRYPGVGGNRRHTVQVHLDALRRLGIQPANNTPLVLNSGVEAGAFVATLLAQHGLAQKKFIVIHPGSRWMFKCWPIDHTIEVCRNLQAMGHSVVFTGAPDKDEARMINLIITGLDQPVTNLQGRLTLKQLGALIEAARLFFGVDSAPMHMAAAVGTPVVALFGPSGENEWAPWQVPQRVLTSQHLCRPCGKDGCGGGKVSDCLVQISPARVLAAIDSLLQETA